VLANVEPVGVVTAVVWGSSEDALITVSSEGKLCWWDIPSGACVRVCAGHQGTVHSLKVSPDGHRLASCGDDGAIKLWDVQSGQHLQTLQRDRPYERLNITGIRGVTEAQKMTLHALGRSRKQAMVSEGILLPIYERT
jgi:WD40 repeat protein